ncbi:MAG: T9SS type A sorting domain-containing protein [Chitinophagales bacterium]
MKITFTFLFYTFIVTQVFCQSTAERVYSIFQTSCTFSSCHNNAAPSLGLDLQGSGPNAMMDVYNNIVNVAPMNVHAVGENNKYIAPGDPERSFLFRKINGNGELDGSLFLHEDEGDPMPKSAEPLGAEDLELVRQWILHGAPATGDVVDVNLIDQFYNNNGVQSVSNPPAKPDPSEGFQLHLGPFFLAPGTEREVFLKHNLYLEDDIEVTSVETTMGIQSHHFIINKFLPANTTVCNLPLSNDGPDSFADGFRDVNSSSHFSALFQVGAQQSERLDVPYNTAFFWQQGTFIDLNSHYINANQNQVLAADVYINIYTQEAGNAKEELQSIMLPNTEISIPNDGEPHTLTQNVPVFFCYPNGIYLWSLASHTHQLGKDFDIYKSNAAGDNIEHLYDGSCFEDGVPECEVESFDYQHPPVRQFDDYYRLSGSDWLKQEATYINNTDSEVGFGLTSEDEMMIMFLFYVEDTTDLHEPDMINSVFNNNIEELSVFPNPTNGQITLLGENESSIKSIKLYNLHGQLMEPAAFIRHQRDISIDLNDSEIPNGMYWIAIEYEDQSRSLAKIIYAN